MSTFLEKKNPVKVSLIVFLASLGIGIISLGILYVLDNYSLLYYGDAISHLINARRFVDAAEPGIGQMITVWLPLPHVMMLPFSMIDSLFVTGLTGTIVNLPLHALTAVFIFKLVQGQTKKQWIAIAGALLYATNPNLIYLGITAMTEAPFMLFFVGSAYFLQRWIVKLADSINFRYILYCSVFVSLATLCRYEAWILSIALIIFTVYFASRKIKQRKKIILVILISLVSGTGILFWLAWNGIAFGDPLEFANAEFYAAASQAVERTNRDSLFLQPQNVLYIYGMAAFMISGPILLAIAVIGYYYYLRQKEKIASTLVCVFLSLPALFTILTMIGGIAEMNHWWFNARFATFLTPLVIVMACMALFRLKEHINKKSVAAIIVAGLFVFQLSSPTFGVVTFADAKQGSEYKQAPYSRQVADYLKENYDDGNIMIITGSAQAHKIMISSGISLATFDEVTESDLHKPSYKEPWKYDDWFIIGLEPDSDSVTAVNYWTSNIEQINSHYSLAYENQYYRVFKIL